MTEAISYVVDADGICTLTMDLPNSKMNVLGAVLQPELDAKLIRAASDPAVRGIIITSAKAAFVAGGDLKALGGDNISQSTVSKGEMARQFMTLSNMLRRMETCGKPVACALNGTAMGGGFEIALASHYRVVADDPKIQLGLPEASVGLLAAGGGTQRLARMLGVQGALPLLMQGKIMNPAAALAAKVVDAVVPKDQMLAECKRWLLEVGDAVKPWDKKGFQVPGGGSSLDKSFRNSFSGTIAMVRGNGYGNYPAPEMICAAVYEGLQLPMDKALGIEAKYFTKLMLDPVARNLIRTMFINKGKADALDGRPEGVAKMVFKKIGVVGAGTMGAGIAFNAAKSGIEVVLIDRDLPSAEKGKAYAEKKLNRDIEKGRSTQDKADAILARIHPTIDYAALGDVQLAIETVFEDKKVKADVLPKIEAAIPADAFIGSNTSRMPISELADYLA
jgi:3-hydroxyacyl-CoA dehydrogenase/enoyl-CoA hydratase/3-hydroxybutyryl-CoA epimerase